MTPELRRRAERLHAQLALLLQGTLTEDDSALLVRDGWSFLRLYEVERFWAKRGKVSA